MVKYAKCDTCGKLDITGWVKCYKSQMCPKCASIPICVDEKLLRGYLQAQLDKNKIVQ